jgi:hypothetical protein
VAMESPKRAGSLDGGLRSPIAFMERHPRLGLAAAVASILGIPLSLYLFVMGQHHRRLTYFIGPARTAIVRAGETENLKVEFSGRDILRDLTAVQVWFWNAGDEPIRNEHVLRKLTIAADKSKVEMLQARLLKTSRNVAGIALDPSHLLDGELSVSWKILEKNDGGVVQVIYEGAPETNFSVSAVVEGQPETVVATPTTPSLHDALPILALAGVVGLLFVWIPTHIFRKLQQDGIKDSAIRKFLYFAFFASVVFAFVVVTMFLSFFITPRVHLPPF